jgi:hypothetical protein
MTPEINGHSAEDLLALHIPLDGHVTTPPRRGKRAVTQPQPELPAPTMLPEAALSSPAPAQPQPSLAADTASLTDTLARSLNITPTPEGPKPDQFVQAVKVVHDRLADARRSLATWQQELEQRELALEARERAVQGREERAAASLALAELCPPRAKPAGFLGRLFKRRG